MRHLIRMVNPDQLKSDPGNARVHSKKQIRQIARSIQGLGFAVPVMINEEGILLAGHGRVDAAKQLGLKAIPAILVEGLTPAQQRALRLADNRIAEHGGWDREKLAVELSQLCELLPIEGLDIEVTGFLPTEIDQIAIDLEERSEDPADALSHEWATLPPVTRLGDLWRLGSHRLLCGDARDQASLKRLMGRDRASAGFLDPPYNLQFSDIVGRGRTRHKKFVMGSGEMSSAEFIQFLVASLSRAAQWSKQGAVHFVCIDWRHVAQLIEAGNHVYDTMLNLIVWVKTNAGQGSFYRSQHELIGVFRVGDETHLNNVELGRHGRSRSNVWHYAGLNTFAADRLAELQAHPTPKPIAMIADALKDCTRRNDVVLDTFCGSGATILAAHRVGRRACGIEIEPIYVDVAIRRWQAFTKMEATHVATGLTFEEIAANRAGPLAGQRLQIGGTRT